MDVWNPHLLSHKMDMSQNMVPHQIILKFSKKKKKVQVNKLCVSGHQVFPYLALIDSSVLMMMLVLLRSDSLITFNKFVADFSLGVFLAGFISKEHTQFFRASSSRKAEKFQFCTKNPTGGRSVLPPFKSKKLILER